MEKILRVLPVGFRFNPTDEELVKDYLLRKIKGEELPINNIKSFDLYGDLSPWEIFQKYNSENSENSENKILYVFTVLKRASPYRISRVSGCGTWHADKRVTEIYDGDEGDEDVIIGLKKTFSFRSNESNGYSSKRGEWIMNEFSLAGKYFLGKQKCDYVLCRIKKIGKSCLEAEAVVSEAILPIGLEAEAENFHAGGYAEKNEDDDLLLLDELDPLLQIDTKEWNLYMLEKYLMDDDDHEQQQQQTVPEAAAADQYSCTGDWIPPSTMERNSKLLLCDANMEEEEYINENEAMMVESEPAFSNMEEDWSIFFI